ncbi:MAG TPA: secretin N-terminal domain-containing protein [Terracidiphilus sp.]|jgi:type II secretory pathway component GspD/PulD (secretin)
MTRTNRTLALAFTLTLATVPHALAQAATKPAEASAAKSVQEAPASKTCPDCAARRKDYDSLPTRTFYFKYASQAADMNEIATAMRQLLPSEDRVYLVPAQGAILIRAIPEDLALAQKVIDDLDRPKKTWRLTYTLTEMDGDKRVGTQHYAMDMVEGQQANLQQDSKVPVPTGTYSAGGASGATTGVQTSFTYQNVGITFNATLVPQAAGARLQSDIQQNGLADTTGTAGPVVFRSSSLKGAYLLTPGKPLVLGTMDAPGSTHHFQIEVLMEPLP